MAMFIGMIVVLIGVVIGFWTMSGSGIHARPHGRDDRYEGESPLDSPWQMGDWGRGAQSSRRRKRR